MTTENITLNFNDALKALNEAVATFKTDVYVPSVSKTITFKDIDAKQQKDLLNAAMDTTVYSIGFTKAFYNILKDNLVSDDNIDNLSITDKTVIALALKSKISNEVNVFFDENNTKSEKFDIASILDKFKNYITPSPKTLTVSNENTTLVVNIALPTIKTELDYDNQVKDNKKTEDIKTTEEVQNIISNAFIGETTKYVNSVIVNGSEINFSTLNLEQKIKVIEKIPSNIIQQILESASIWKKEIDQILTVTSTDGITKIIAIDSLLFLN
jgi:hypothetical protein